MKKLIGLVVIIAALVLGGYYGMGLVTERTLKKNVAIINQSNGLFVDIEQYHRGWFKSVAVLNWRLHIPEHLVNNQNGPSTTAPAQDYNVQMPLTIFHGPIIISDMGLKFGLGYAHSDVAMPAMYLDKFSNLFTNESTKPKLVLSLFVNYLNNSSLEIGVPTFKLIAKQGGAQFEWDGMESDLHVSSNLKNIDGNLSIEGIQFIRDKIKISLSKISTNYDLHQTNAGMYLGEANFALPSLVVDENDQKLGELEQLNIHANSDIQNGLFEHDSKASFDKLTIKDKTYGPALLEVGIKNIDANVLADLNEQANKIQQGSDSSRQQALLLMLPQLPKLFSQGAQFEISKLSLVVPEGLVEGDLLISLPKGDVGNPFQLLQKVQGHGQLKLPMVVLKQFMMASVRQQLLAQASVQKQAPLQTATPAAPAVTTATPEPAIATTGLQEKVDGSEKATIAESEKEPSSASEKTSANPLPLQEVKAPAPAPENQAQSATLTVAELEQQAMTLTDKKLSALVEAGLLSIQGSEYVIEMNLQQGQLLVNGKPFNPAMMKF